MKGGRPPLREGSEGAVGRRVFLLLAAVGAVVPYAAFAVFISRHGLDVALLVRQAFGSPGATFFSLDVVMSALAVIAAVTLDRLDARARWLSIAATLVVGPSCGLPLWLALRRPPSGSRP